MKHALARFLAAAAVAVAPAATLAASSGTIEVSAVVLSKSVCKFSNNGNQALAFGSIDPSSTSDAPATVVVEIVCNGSSAQATFSMSAGNGLNYSGGTRRVRVGATSAYMPYSLSFTPTSATVNKGAPTNITVTGTIAPSGFANATAGTYSDTVSITISP